MSSCLLRILLLACLAWTAAAPARADRFELTDGSVVLGRLVWVEEGTMTIATAFVGLLDIGVDKVRAYTTDDQLIVTLHSGDEIAGRVVSAAGAVQVGPPGFGRTLDPAKIAVIRAPAGAVPPGYEHLTRPPGPRWSYEASVAIAGRTGPAERFGGNLKTTATHAGPAHRLVLGAAVDRATDKGTRTADREAASVDYSANYTPADAWYVRAALERDIIRNLDFRASTAAGYGHKLINTREQILEVRLGASLLREAYATGTRLLSPALDLSVSHMKLFGQSRLTDSLVVTPTLRYLEDFRVHHESAFDVPLLAALGRLRIGLTNDYLSSAPVPTARLDTTYFTSLVLEWK